MNPDTPLTRTQKILLGVTFSLGLSMCGASFWLDSRQRTEQVHGYIVAKEWEKRHMSDSRAQYVQQASLLGYVHVPVTHFPQLVPSSFTIWVANRYAVRAITVDSAQWLRLRCGQRYTYSYTH